MALQEKDIDARLDKNRLDVNQVAEQKMLAHLFEIMVMTTRNTLGLLLLRSDYNVITQKWPKVRLCGKCTQPFVVYYLHYYG